MKDAWDYIVCLIEYYFISCGVSGEFYNIEDVNTSIATPAL